MACQASSWWLVLSTTNDTKYQAAEKSEKTIRLLKTKNAYRCPSTWRSRDVLVLLPPLIESRRKMIGSARYTSEVSAGDAIPWTAAQTFGFPDNEVWNAGHTKPRFDRLDKKMAIRPLGTIHTTVKHVTQIKLTSLFHLRADLVSGRFSQIMSLGRGARAIVVPSGRLRRAFHATA